MSYGLVTGQDIKPLFLSKKQLNEIGFKSLHNKVIYETAFDGDKILFSIKNGELQNNITISSKKSISKNACPVLVTNLKGKAEFTSKLFDTKTLSIVPLAIGGDSNLGWYVFFLPLTDPLQQKLKAVDLSPYLISYNKVLKLGNSNKKSRGH